jgi:hypothetical protein
MLAKGYEAETSASVLQERVQRCSDREHKTSRARGDLAGLIVLPARYITFAQELDEVGRVRRSTGSRMCPYCAPSDFSNSTISCRLKCSAHPSGVALY